MKGMSATVEIKTGTEWHGFGRANATQFSATIKIDGKPIDQVLKPIWLKWVEVAKGASGLWSVERYEIPAGSAVTFEASSTGFADIHASFIVGVDESLEIAGHKHKSQICGWILEID